MKYILIIFALGVFACGNSVPSKKQENTSSKKEKKILKTGAENPKEYLSLLQNKNVAVVTNQTGVLRLFDAKDSVIGTEHLVDFLLQKEVKVKAIFAPEHGFRGKEDAGTRFSRKRRCGSKNQRRQRCKKWFACVFIARKA